MQEGRPEFEAGRDLPGIANGKARLLQRVPVLLVAREIGKQREIVARSKTLEMRLEPAFEIVVLRS